MSDEHNHITDRELRALLKKRMLEADASDALAEQLLEQEAMLAFGADAVFTPSAEKEKQLVNDLGKTKKIFKINKWFLLAGIAVAIICALLVWQGGAKKAVDKKQTENKKNSAATSQTQNVSAAAEKTTQNKTPGAALNNDPAKAQLVKILKENADCSHAILVTDSVVFSPHSPAGTGYNLEIKNNPPDDPMYFEKEHNTIWYRYVVKDDGLLTFDIIPVDQNDDYDFTLYSYNGSDLSSKVISKDLKPVRACISRNDKSLKSCTGLKADLELPSYIRSGEGVSYVRHMDVKKGDMLYLLVDNVYSHGKGHTIRFHLKTFVPGELHVGDGVTFSKISFKDSDDEFRKGSEKALDSLYKFLMFYPDIKVEIGGHVNKTVGNNPVRIAGKPAYTALELSQRRAEVIIDYLVKRGIVRARLVPKGYGNSKPLIKNPKTIRENIMNVRTEVLILSLSYK